MRQLPSAPPAVLNLGLFLTVALFGAAVFQHDASAFDLAVWLHTVLRVYDGRFVGWRRAIWLALLAVQLLIFTSGFLSAVLPWGQIAFWLADKLGAGAIGIAPVLEAFRIAIGLLSWPVIIASMVALHGAGVRFWSRWQVAAFIVLAFVAPAAIGDIIRLAAPLPQPDLAGGTPPNIVPPMNLLPLYAILRSVPSKTFGLALLGVVMVLPVAAAWTRAWRFHARQTRLAWIALSLAYAGSWVGLGVIGARPPDIEGQWIALALVAYQAAYVLIAPFLLARYARPDDSRTLVFE